VNAELFTNVPAVVADREYAQVEHHRNLLAGFTLANVPENFLLSRSEGRNRLHLFEM
jgi:hypothetical protein